MRIPSLILLVACESPGSVQTVPQAVEPRPASIPENTRTVNLIAKAAEFVELRPGATDGEFYVYRSPNATVHMHVIGVGQMCPLHIHRTTREATVIVQGTPAVQHVYGAGSDTLIHEERRVPEGQLVASLPYCGHRWENVEDTVQANLVIASPRFDGNLYVDPDDARMVPGPPPLVLDPAARRAERGVGVHAIEGFGGGLSLLAVDGQATVPGGQDTVLYVVSGKGTLDGQPIGPGVAAVVQGDKPAVLVAQDAVTAWQFVP